MKGWLDKYGKEINANEGRSSASKEWVGEGYSTKGRNYSPAWGGQFQLGGNIYPVNYTPQAQNGLSSTDKKLKELGSDAYTAMAPFYNTIYEAANKYANPETGLVSRFNNFRAGMKGLIKHPEVIFMKRHPLPDQSKDPYNTGSYQVDDIGNIKSTN